MKGYSSYYKKQAFKFRYIFLTIIIILVIYLIVSNASNLPFLNIKNKKYKTIEEYLEKYDKEKDRSQKKIILNKANKYLNKLLAEPDYEEDGYLAYLAGSKVRRDLGWKKRSETIRNGKELTEFFRLGVELVEKVEPEYDSAGLRYLLEYLDSEWNKL